MPIETEDQAAEALFAQEMLQYRPAGRRLPAPEPGTIVARVRELRHKLADSRSPPKRLGAGRGQYADLVEIVLTAGHDTWRHETLTPQTTGGPVVNSTGGLLNHVVPAEYRACTVGNSTRQFQRMKRLLRCSTRLFQRMNRLLRCST